jgi:hypothetical protein
VSQGSSKRFLTSLACLLAISCLCGATPAQSGRRPPERPWTKRAPEPDPGTQPASQPKAEDEMPTPKFLVTAMKDGLSFEVPPSVADAVLAGCVSTLNTIPGVSARGSKDGSRKDAIETAKSEMKALTLYISVEADSMASAASRNAAYALVGNYYLYLPGTGKVRTQGRVYMNYRYGLQQPRGVPGVIAPRTGGELYPYEAGQEIAKRIASMVQEPVEVPKAEPEAKPEAEAPKADPPSR